MTEIAARIVLIILLVSGSLAIAQDSIVKDSAFSPFRKGRWLTGISGSINSARSETTGIEEVTNSNEYALNIVGGNFFKDRWLIGGII